MNAKIKSLLTTSLLGLSLIVAGTSTTAHAGKKPNTAEKTTQKKSDMAKFGATPAERNKVDTDGKVRRGTLNPYAETAEYTVDQLVTKASELDGKKVRVTGNVSKVCAKKGCWWMLQAKNPEQNIRVTAKDYGFFVPENAPTKKVTVWGTFKVKQLSAQKARHYAEDALKAGQKVEMKDLQARQEFSIVSDGLVMEPKAVLK